MHSLEVSITIALLGDMHTHHNIIFFIVKLRYKYPKT